MKHFLGTLIAFSFVFLVNAQYTIKGYVINEQTNQPVEAASVTLATDGIAVASRSTSTNGFYEFHRLKKGSYRVTVEHVSMQPKTADIEISETVTIKDISVQHKAYYLEPLEVKALRVSEKAPFTKTNVSKQEIEKMNVGQDLPFLLNQTPGVVINSDAGNGIGYTGMRIRGSDATRINITINGIPYNDPESQGTFLVDLPDIASSVNSIQIQRGVGTSSNGAGAFGASMHLSTNEFNEKPYAEFNNSYGSFNSWKNTVKAGSGLINDHFTIDARLSKIRSDGYIERASSDLKSFYFSTAYINKKSTVRLNVFSGLEKTYQAWNGVAESMLATNRRYNSAGTAKPGTPYNNETDNYQQDHYQLFFNQSINSNLSFNTAIFLVNGSGYYEQYRANGRFSSYGLANPVVNGNAITRTDLVRQLWLDNSFYGQIFSAQYKKNSHELTVGGAWNRYNGDHFGKVIWAQTGIPKDHKYYDVNADKTDNNIYAKWQHMINTHWLLYADLQYRNVDYNINGFRNNPKVTVDRHFNFINPKAGITYSKGGLLAYLSYAVANKEPNRSDFEAGIAQQPQAEKLNDLEIGIEKINSTYKLGATVYHMAYTDQLILTGQINDVGAYTRVNVPKSYRLGVELQGSANISSWMNAAANITVSRNKIKSFTGYMDNYDNSVQVKSDYHNTDISFSPSVIAAATINFIPVQNAEISLLNKFVGRQYLDNTENKTKSLNPFNVHDLRVTYTIKKKLFREWTLIGFANNLFNKLYEPNGYTFSYVSGGTTTTENYYYPMAGRNYMIGVNVKM